MVVLGRYPDIAKVEKMINSPVDNFDQPTGE